ncbi:MAG TPA: alanine racemase C-terminal domain-containing protein [Salinivirgaceae bacterium]|nr:alanine racemase C-terminal domain-containing protein [Salinivirgaceae bacterium]
MGYSRKGVLSRTSRIATLPVGYADGYRRCFGNGRGKVWVNGTLVPTVGNICMDITMIDVTDAYAEPGDEVILFGQNPSILQLAEIMQSIPYEVLTGISSRVKRVYVRE